MIARGDGQERFLFPRRQAGGQGAHTLESLSLVSGNAARSTLIFVLSCHEVTITYSTNGKRADLT